jgi:hypothetical protein
MPWDRIVVELAAFGLALTLTVAALRRGRRALFTLVSAFFFGLLIELFFVTIGNELDGVEYGYGEFAVMLGGVPLWVATGWGVIVFAATEAADRLRASPAATAITAGLLALSIDIALDPVAAGLGWWAWRWDGEHHGFLGVPFDNFLGWVMIVSFFVGFTRAGFSRWPDGGRAWRDVLIPVAAIPLSIVAVAVTQHGLGYLYARIGQPLTFLLVMLPLVAVALRAFEGASRPSAPRWYVLAVPLVTHAVALGVTVLTGLWATRPALLIVLPMAAVVSLVGHGAVAWRTPSPART